MVNLLRRKSADVSDTPASERLKRTLNGWHLIALGVGAIVGTGIYTLVGVGANLAGPGVILSFVVAGVICACAALAYAEVSSMIPLSGSAYTYSYVVLGEIIAWVVAWSLILEYSLVVSAVAVGWSGYVSGFLTSAGIGFPHAFAGGPEVGGVLNVPAMAIIGVVAGLLMMGTRESATVNAVLVVIKVTALLLFIAVVLPHMDTKNFHPFLPYGVLPHDIDGIKHGVMAAAAIIFFAFYGFDAISTAGEEVKNPGRDLPLGIIGSLVICTVLYVGVAAAAVGSMAYTNYAHSAEPLALILRDLNMSKVAMIIGAAAIVALPTVILAFLYGQSRIFYSMARDGLLPEKLALVSARTGTPIRVTVVTAILVAILAGLVPLSEIAALANAGTLMAFVAVSVCLLVLRQREPGRRRPFRVPFAWIVAPVAIAGCVYLFSSLSTTTQIFFLSWNVAGLAYYLIRTLRPGRG